MVVAAWLLAALAALTRHTSANVATPMTKVVELLDDIQKQLEADAAEEVKMYNKYKMWCDDEVTSDRRTIKKTKAEIKDLIATLEAEEAFRKQKATEIEDLANEISQNEADLEKQEALRKKERAAYLEEERMLINSIDALERSLEVLGKKAPAAALPQTASLASVASMLRKTIEHSPDLSINADQQMTLDSFYRMAVTAQRQPAGGPALDFLQMDSQELGDYEKKSGGVKDTLETILEKTKKDKDEKAKSEMQAQHAFELLTMPMRQEIEDGKKLLDEKKTQVAKSEQTSAEKTAEKTAAEEILKSTEKHLDDTLASCHQKVLDYQATVAERSDEIMAIKMALKIMTSSAAKKLSGKQTIGSDLQLSFMQTKSTTRRALAHLRASRSAALSLLSSNAQEVLNTAADPFAKVKGMIQDMLAKLLEEHAQEAEHKGWCDQEMSKSTKSKKQHEKEVEKMESRIDQMESQLSELTDEIEQLTKDMADMQAAVSKATQIRGKEKHKNMAGIKEYKDAQMLLKNAMDVLKEFYDGKETTLVQTDSDENEQADPVKAQGASAGVIGLLEIAIADFAQLEEETKTAESTAAHEYETFMKDSEVQNAVYGKDYEYKHTAKVRVEGELQKAKADLEGYQNELAAVNGYLEKLKPQCTVKVDSYEERKERRDKEIKSLQEALAIISGEAIP